MALFVSAPVQQPQQHTLYTLLLGIGQTFSLSNLPLVGQSLAEIENVEIGGMSVIVSSDVVSKETATAINASISSTLSMLQSQLGSSAPSIAYPTMPPEGLPGTLLFHADLTFGSDTLPLELVLGVPEEEMDENAPAPEALSLAVLDEAPSQPVTLTQGQTVSTSTPDGTWHTVQKSFGPVDIERVGALYLTFRISRM
jgi:hypothetical protein